MVIFHSYVSLPEGTGSFMPMSHVCIGVYSPEIPSKSHEFLSGTQANESERELLVEITRVSSLVYDTSKVPYPAW